MEYMSQRQKIQHRYAPYYLEQRTFSPIILRKTYKLVRVFREYVGKQVLTKVAGVKYTLVEHPWRAIWQ